MRDVIVLAGGYRLDTMGASAVRAIGLAQMIQGLGYPVIVMGKFQSPPAAARSREGITIAGVTCRDIIQPVAGKACASYVSSAEPLMRVVDELGAARVRAVVCYNYPARGAWAMIRAARERGIAPVLDCTEWYGWEGRKILRNLWRLAGVETRMRLLTRLAGNVACTSRWFCARIPRQHSVLLPFALDVTRPEWQRGPAPDPAAPAHLVYSGSPGVGMSKDRLPVMIAALARLAKAGHDFRLTIAGMTAEQYLEDIPQHQDQIMELGDRARFLGRIPHEASLEMLRGADFAVFFRKPGRVANTGFPTKYVEAATLGVPVVTNPTSDIPCYLRDGENGILASRFDHQSIEQALRRAVTMPPEDRAAMVAQCRAENPFDMRLFREETRVFLEKLRGLNG